MAYTIKFTTKEDTENGVTFKLERDKTKPLHEDIADLANVNKAELIKKFGYSALNTYVKLKDNNGWKLICDMKLSLH